MLTPPARRGAGPAGAGAAPAAPAALHGGADGVSLGARAERTLLLLALATRSAYCLYAAAVVAVNLGGYGRPAMAGAALGVALACSAALGAWVWRRRAVTGPVAALDAVVAALVLLMVAAAIKPPGQSGSLNWALAYAAACAMWLGFGAERRAPGGRAWPLRGVVPMALPPAARFWRFWLACELGVVYGITALRGGAGPASTITAIVNAASVPMYFGIAAAMTWVVRRIAAEMAAQQEREQRQRRDLAALGERERLVGQVHQSVLATLEEIAAGEAPWEELRGRSRAQVIELRGAFREHGADHAGGLRALLAALARDRSGDGWLIDLVDDELEAEPAPGAAGALRDALAELIAGPVHDGRGRVRAQARGADDGTELVARIPGDARAMTAPLARARARLAQAAGTAGLEPARPGEVRVRLRVPA
jgi:hypothetical protein